MTRLLGIIMCMHFIAHAAPADEAEAAARRGDFDKAIEILTPLAEAGDVDALGNLGNMYAFGRGVPKDRVKAEAYWRCI